MEEKENKEERELQETKLALIAALVKSEGWKEVMAVIDRMIERAKEDIARFTKDEIMKKTSDEFRIGLIEKQKWIGALTKLKTLPSTMEFTLKQSISAIGLGSERDLNFNLRPKGVKKGE